MNLRELQAELDRLRCRFCGSGYPCTPDCLMAKRVRRLIIACMVLIDEATYDPGACHRLDNPLEGNPGLRVNRTSVQDAMDAIAELLGELARKAATP